MGRDGYILRGVILTIEATIYTVFIVEGISVQAAADARDYIHYTACKDMLLCRPLLVVEVWC